MDINEKMRQVPFGMSMFQIQRFVADQKSPERTYRQVLLQYDTKKKAMKECEFRRKRINIDIEEIEEKLRGDVVDEYQRKRLLVDLEEKEYNLEHEIKLIEDCVIEMKVYEDIISNLPDYTREEFESAELGYWKQRLLDNANREVLSKGFVGEGTIESLEKIGLTYRRNESGQIMFVETEEFKMLENKNIIKKDKTN
jgi:hypothetical protein